MLSKDDILTKFKSMLPMLSTEYAVERIGLFGSYINGEESKDSDIDLLVRLDRPIGWKFFTLQILLEETFGKKVDLITEKGLRTELKQQI
ncbi:MAG: nucleotidyltransferase domain-containing protein [Cryomorphaceae bacterium]